MDKELKIAKENLYSTFSEYPFKSTIEGCPCCVSDSDKSTLHSKPLRELEDEDLSRFAFKAMTTWGDVNDYKYYLPRIFELASQRKLIVDTFVILRKLEYAKWKQWEPKEQKAINEFLIAWWNYDVNNANYFDSEILIEIHKLIPDIKLMLNQWNLDIKTQGFKNYVEFIQFNYNELAEKKKRYITLSEKEVEFFKNWVKLNKDKLEHGFFEYEKKDKEFSERISNSLYMLDRIK